MILRPGIYEISSQLKYLVENEKGQQMNISHTEYEQIYLRVTEPTTS